MAKCNFGDNCIPKFNLGTRGGSAEVGVRNDLHGLGMAKCNFGDKCIPKFNLGTRGGSAEAGARNDLHGLGMAKCNFGDNCIPKFNLGTRGGGALRLVSGTTGMGLGWRSATSGTSAYQLPAQPARPFGLTEAVRLSPLRSIPKFNLGTRGGSAEVGVRNDRHGLGMAKCNFGDKCVSVARATRASLRADRSGQAIFAPLDSQVPFRQAQGFGDLGTRGNGGGTFGQEGGHLACGV